MEQKEFTERLKKRMKKLNSNLIIMWDLFYFEDSDMIPRISFGMRAKISFGMKEYISLIYRWPPVNFDPSTDFNEQMLNKLEDIFTASFMEVSNLWKPNLCPNQDKTHS